MIRFIFGFILFAASYVLLAQDHPTCNTQRYRVDVFDNVKVTDEIEYSESTTIGGNTQKLYMDIYEPEGDVASNRPVVLLAFGGSFITGNRRDVSTLCTRFAQKGYVAVSIDYRLYDLPFIPLPTEAEMQDVVVKAIKDMKAAIKFLDGNAKGDNTYGLDMDWLFVGGISSGSITASHTAMLDSTDIFSSGIQAAIDKNAPVDGISNSKETVQIKGVINYSGALNNVNWIDANDPPFISYHEDEDPTVPYKDGYAKIFGQDIISLSGSYSMDSAASKVGVNSVLNTINSNSHVAYFFNQEKTTEIIDETALFMYEMICSETADVNEVENSRPYSFGPNPSEGLLTIKVNGNATVSLSDMTGRLIEKQSFAQSATLSLVDLKPGAYLINIQIGEKVYTEKVIKK